MSLPPHAVQRLFRHLTTRAVEWLLARSASQEDAPRPEEALTRARLEKSGLPWSPAWGAFDEAFGGVSIFSESGRRHVFGLDEWMSRSIRSRDGRVTIGTFDGGDYQMDRDGRVWADDQVLPPFVIADDWKRLVERFAIGQEYPASTFQWSGRFAIEIIENVSLALAGALGAEPVPELSDTCQSVLAAPGVGIWSPPEYAEMSVAACVAVAQDEAMVRRVLETLAANCPDVGAAVGLGSPGVRDEIVSEVPSIPANSKGLRFERWFAPETPGALVLTEGGGVEQWSAVKGGVQVDKIEPSSVTRTRRIQQT